MDKRFIASEVEPREEFLEQNMFCRFRQKRFFSKNAKLLYFGILFSTI